MNILFLAENELSQFLGGTDRISITLANSFAQKGHKCFLAYCRKVDNPDNCLFADKLLLDSYMDESVICDFLSDNQVDIIVSNFVGIDAKRRYLPLFRQASLKTGAKLVACYHAMPGEDLLGNRICNSFWRILHGGSLSSNLKDMALNIMPQSIVKSLFKRKIEAKYRLLYDNGDAVVFHTDIAGKIFAQIASLPYDEKFVAIPSALSYNSFLDPSEIPSKNKEILLIARMDEKSKRISFALRAWAVICRKPEFSGWKFTIAGGGPDLEYFRKMTKRLKLNNISILGRVDDIVPLYKRSSIFLMTSSYEGWGLTLTESQQFGCVPVVLDSFPSLPAVVQNGRNGIISPNNELSEYVSNVEWLMSHPEERADMAANAISDSHKWEISKVTDIWLSLFERLLS